MKKASREWERHGIVNIERKKLDFHNIFKIYFF